MEALGPVFFLVMLAAVVVVVSYTILAGVDAVRNFGKVTIKERTVIGADGGRLFGLISGTASKLPAFNTFLLMAAVWSVVPVVLVWKAVLDTIKEAGLAMSIANMDMAQYDKVEMIWTYGFPVVCFVGIGLGCVVVKCLIGIAAVLCAEYLEALADG